MKNNKEFGLIFKVISHLLHNQELLMRSVCKDYIYAINDTNELSVLSGKLSKAYYKEGNTNRDTVIDCLDELKERHPNQEIIVETPKGTVSFKIGDALIYEGNGGEIVIDSE